jgi:hypothetical protein
MRVELIRRPNPSPLFSAVSPLLALAIMILLGAIMFALLTPKGPDQIVTLQERIQFSSTALYTYFVEPLTETWSLHELLIKAAPLILIAVGLSVCFLSNNWNIGAEGQFIVGAIAGSIIPIVFPGFGGPLVLPLMLLMGILGGMAYAAIPAILKARFNTSEILSSLMLVYVAQLFLDWMVRGPWRNPEGFNFPGKPKFSCRCDPAGNRLLIRSCALRFRFRADRRGLAMWFTAEQDAEGLRDPRTRPEPAGRAVRRLFLYRYGDHDIPDCRRPGRPCRHQRGLRRDRPTASGRFRPATASPPSSSPFSAASIRSASWPPVSCWRCPISAARRSRCCPAATSRTRSPASSRAFLLFSVLACDTLIHYRIRIALRAGAAG